jgi:hypothetical protein
MDMEYEQLSDYAVVYADNVILQLGSNNAKLIFYQIVTKVNEAGNDIEKNRICKRLKFEVRIPRHALEKLSTIAFGLIQAQKIALESTKGRNEANVTRAWYEVDKIIGSATYDTENYALNPDDFIKLQEASSNLAARMMSNQKPSDDSNDTREQ